MLGDEIIKVQKGIQDLLLEKSVIGHYDDTGNWVRIKVDDLITEDVLKSML